MQIETQIQGNRAVLRLKGRLDAAWAEHFHSAVREALRDGHHHVRIDAAGLEYLSSAGIRTLLRIQRELAAVKGSFGIIRASAFVADTLRLSGLQLLLLPETEAATADATSPVVSAPVGAVLPPRGSHFDRHPLTAGGQITVRAVGGWKPWQTVAANDAVDLGFPRTVFGLGIGAAGRDVADARSHFGEFVAAAGCLAWLPGDGADTPDYLEQAESFVPRLHTIQALTGQGSFAHLLRFRPQEKGDVVTLSDLFLQAFATTPADAVAMVVLAEVDGLVGVALARSPGLIQAADRPADFPELRTWLAFCGERLHRQTLALVVAFASRDPAHAAVPGLAPLPSCPATRAHAHAVVLPFQPLPQGLLELEPAVRAAFKDSEPRGLLHLLEDDRPVIGLGQSAFIRGACWCAPVQFSKESPL
jgi:anti-anti-sigma factor